MILGSRSFDSCRLGSSDIVMVLVGAIWVQAVLSQAVLAQPAVALAIFCLCLRFGSGLAVAFISRLSQAWFGRRAVGQQLRVFSRNLLLCLKVVARVGLQFNCSAQSFTWGIYGSYIVHYFPISPPLKLSPSLLFSYLYPIISSPHQLQSKSITFHLQYVQYINS